MKYLKQKHFKDVHQYWHECDILLYTNTLTAGISFENIHFDLSINFAHHDCFNA
jgi:hypothetical protein